MESVAVPQGATITYASATICSSPDCGVDTFLRVLDSLTYKQGFIKQIALTLDSIIVQFQIPVTDIFDQVKDANLHQAWTYHHDMLHNMNAKASQNLIRHCLMDMETHEMDEWIAFDGDRIFDPHRPQWKPVLHAME